jgi:hypothetical protein
MSESPASAVWLELAEHWRKHAKEAELDGKEILMLKYLHRASVCEHWAKQVAA